GGRRNLRGAPGPNRGRPPRPAEGTGKIRCFATLQQHNNNQHEAVQNKKCFQQPSGITESERNDTQTNQQRDSPFHPTRHCLLLISSKFPACAGLRTMYNLRKTSSFQTPASNDTTV